MKICVIGNDKRYECLKNLLIHMGHEISCDAPELVVTGCPFPENLPECGIIAACGPKHAPGGIFDIMKDEEYLADAAYMTAEGAVAAAMVKTISTIRDARCMIVGWGRIGRALCRLLINMGARVCVCTRRKSAHPEIAAAGAEARLNDEIAGCIGGYDMIFSTAPALVIGKKELENVRPDAIVMDLASPPYGVDLDSAREMNVNAWREPALPGRYCPENAARAIYSALVRGGVING